MAKLVTKILALSAVAVLLLASKRQDIEADDGDMLGGFSLDALAEKAETAVNVVTEQGVTVGSEQAQINVMAFLDVLKAAEGTSRLFDPYRACFGYRHTIASFADHPAITGEWMGERLSDAMCSRAGFGPGCKSTAAGAYQIIRGTWLNIKAAKGLRDFSPASQDAAAVELIRRRGALNDVMSGRFSQAVNKCRNEWASLPGNFAGQGQRSLDQLTAWYAAKGGMLA